MIEQHKQAIVEKLGLVVSMAEQASMRVAGGMRTVNDALDALAVGMRELTSAEGKVDSRHDADRYEALNNLLRLAATACDTVNESVRKAHHELGWALSQTEVDAAGSAQLAQLRRQATETLGVLSTIDAASSLAVSAMSLAALQLQCVLRHRIAEQSSWQETQALVQRLVSSQSER